MTHFRRLAKFTTFGYVLVFFSFLFLAAQATLAQRPNLGTASTYAIFTGGGAINNTGLSVLTGDVGQDGAYSFNGFPPGTYSGTLNRNNGASALAKSDLLTAWTNEAAVTCGFVLGVGIVDGQSFDPAVYCAGGATTTTGNITFNAHGNASAIFIVKIDGMLSANAGTHILLANGALATNIYWFVNGAVNIADNSTFKGVIVAKGAITFLGTSTLDGRALTTAGAINIAANSMGPVAPGPTNNITITHPAMGDTVKGATQNYQIIWTGSGIASKKIFAYSLDSGLTWKTIDTLTADVLTHNWNVPDTVSTKAMVRITDANGLVGLSGTFVIASSKSPGGTIVVAHPAIGDTIAAGKQNYQVTWTGTDTSQKTIEISLDGGLTWKTIGTVAGTVTSFNWNVPDTALAMAMIRITGKSGATAKSGIFVIKAKTITPGTIVVVTPAQGEVIAGGTANYQITFTAANTTPMKTFEYSLDGGATWNLIGVAHSSALSFTWASVPNVATTNALVRITDSNGARGTSGQFTITKTPGVGSIDGITLTGLDNYRNIGNNLPLGIAWTFTPDIGTSVVVEYSLDYGITWNLVDTVLVSELPSTTWTTTATGVYNSVFIRLTSTKGMTRISAPFSIGLNASVSFGASKNGYSISNYPNPASGQTTISLVLPVASDVTLTIVDAIGREVSRTATQYFNAGNSKISVNTGKLSAGMYTYILQAGATKLAGRMNILK